MRVIEASWYDYPAYYDLAFSDTNAEDADLVLDARDRYCVGAARDGRRLFEPACGSGRILVELAGRGWPCEGLDSSAAQIEYLAAKAASRTFPGDGAVVARVGDMVGFALDRPASCAFNLYNSFRHLLTEEAAARHLRCVWQSLAPGGIYLLGMHLIPADLDVDEDDWEADERWHAADDAGTDVTAQLTLVDASSATRTETLRFDMTVKTPDDQFLIREDMDLRLYTAGQLEDLLETVPEFELADVFDFWYDLDNPLTLDPLMEDVLLVLRRPADS